MQEDQLSNWQHSHAFGQDQKRPGELRTFIVIFITATMMVVEIAAGDCGEIMFFTALARQPPNAFADLVTRVPNRTLDVSAFSS